jgi:hypothetical protein
LFDRLLQRFRVFIESGHYAISLHAREEMGDDGLTDIDVESCVLTGSIVERQMDRRTGEWKYVIEGRSLAGERCVVIGKLTLTGKLGILTVFMVEG